jgi:hypothetical protein
MTLESSIRDRLVTVFPDNQAAVLANVVVQAHDALATKADMHEIRVVMREIVEIQKSTDRKLGELTEAQKATERQLAETNARMDARSAETDRQLAEVAARMDARSAETDRQLAETNARMDARSAATDRQLAETNARMDARSAETDRRFAEMAEVHKSTELEIAETNARMDARIEAMERGFAELREVARQSFIRHDRADGWLYELLLVKRLPAYVGRTVKRCRVIDAQAVVEGLEPLVESGRLTHADLDNLRRADLVASGKIGEEPVYLVGEVSCTGDTGDVARAASRAAVVARSGTRVIPFVACHDIGPAAAELADREGVLIIRRGEALPASS